MSKDLRDLVEKLVSDKVNANRRFVDEVLEKIQDRNHQYFLERFGDALKQAETAERAGDASAALRYKVLADTYKSIIERCF
jgi:predicted nucleotidyltransferase component of viral defense system